MSVWIKRSAWVCAAVVVASSAACSSSSVNDSELFGSDSGTLGSGGAKEAGTGSTGAAGGAGGSAGSENPAGGGASGSGGSAVEDAGRDASGGGGAAGAATGGAGGETGGAGGETGGTGGETGGTGGETGGAGGGGGTGGACVPATCPSGLCNTSFPDGCGGIVTCGGCGSNAFACIANSCQLIVTSACGSCPGNLSVLAQIAGSDDCNCGGGGVMCANAAYVVAHGFSITCPSGSKFANSVYDCSTAQTYSVCVQ